MQQSWNGLAHVGVIHPMAYPATAKGEGPILETITKIAEDEFFGAIEVTRILDDTLRKKVGALLECAHMDVIYSGQPPLLMGKLNLNAEDAADRAKAVDACKVSVDQAYDLGARILCVLSGPDPGADKREAAMALLVDSLVQICRYAEAKATCCPLMVSLETFDQTIDKKCLIGPSTDAMKLAAMVKSTVKNFGLTVDLSHMPLLNETPEQCLTTVAEPLVHVHIGNCAMKEQGHPAYGDVHPRFGIKGGENDVPQLVDFLRALDKIGFLKKSVPTSLPVISFEVKPLADESSEVVIANAKRVLKEAWAKA